ncbi:MAG: response regulator [Chloroflexota bacterium]|nr:response regulator [Chloroflexota bacterium]
MPAFEAPPDGVLVVEDDAAVTDLVREVLFLEGYTVTTVADGAAALAAVASAPPALILLDLQMPVMDGRSFLHAYRTTVRHSAAIVLLSAGLDLPRAARELGVDGYLRKPFTLDELLDVVGITLAGALHSATSRN